MEPANAERAIAHEVGEVLAERELASTKQVVGPTWAGLDATQPIDGHPAGDPTIQVGLSTIYARTAAQLAVLLARSRRPQAREVRAAFREVDPRTPRPKPRRR